MAATGMGARVVKGLQLIPQLIGDWSYWRLVLLVAGLIGD